MSECVTIPILPACNLTETANFYEKLGGEPNINFIFMNYLIVSFGEFEIHFFHHAELIPAENYSSCFVRTLNVDKWYEILARANLNYVGIPRLEKPGIKPWKMKEFALIDINGNLVRFGEVLN